MISLIIPVFNAAKYLDQCLQSVVGQSYTDWECILVDDGSTDKSGEICDRWASVDARIKVIHQDNLGVSVARNRGIDNSQGEYICFVDSDDWVEASYLSDMLACLDDSNRLIISGIITEKEEGSHLVCPSKELLVQLTTGSQSSEWVDYINLFYGPFVKLYNRRVVVDNSLLFPEGQSLGEDMIFNLDYLSHIDEVLFIPKANYHYRIASGRSLSTMFRNNKFEIEYDLWKRRRLLFDETGLWNERLKEYMDTQLGGIIYNGIFNGPQVSYKSITKILDTPEISDLSLSSFTTSPRIKKAILNRDGLFFYLLRKIKG